MIPLTGAQRCCLTGRRTFVEALERRRLLSGVVADGIASLTPSAVSSNLKVSFQPASTTTLTPGYKADIGRLYGRRSNGRTYGWSAASEASAVRRDVAGLDQRLTNFINTNAGKTWEAAVTNGTYQVHAVSGDPTTTSGSYRFLAEGKPLMIGDPMPGHPFTEGFVTVTVTDGRLTIASDTGAINNKLNYIEIKQVAPPVPPAQGAAINWSQNAAYDTIVGRVEAGVIHLGEKVYVFGGYTSAYSRVLGRMDVYNTATNSYKRLASLPGAQSHWGVATDGKFIYAVAGQISADSTKGTAEAWKYDIAANVWTPFVSLPEVRYGGSMAFVAGKLHFFGGSGPDRITATSTHWALDLANPTAGWRAAAKMPLPTDHMGVQVVNDTVYLLGGEVEHGVSYLGRDNVFAYDPATDTYDEKAPMPTAASHFEGNVVYDGTRIFVLGGQNNAQRWSDEVRSYDLLRDKWEVHTAMPVTRKAGISWTTRGKLFYTAGEQTGAGEPASTYEGIFA